MPTSDPSSVTNSRWIFRVRDARAELHWHRGRYTSLLMTLSTVASDQSRGRLARSRYSSTSVKKRPDSPSVVCRSLSRTRSLCDTTPRIFPDSLTTGAPVNPWVASRLLTSATVIPGRAETKFGFISSEIRRRCI
jgi:hypothetical protein